MDFANKGLLRLKSSGVDEIYIYIYIFRVTQLTSILHIPYACYNLFGIR
jgi:hypothetical protein